MMNYTEIKDLLNSGFTPEQITLLTTSGTFPSVPETTPAEAATPQEVTESPIKEEAPIPEETEASSEGDSKQNETPDPLAEIRETVRKLQEENAELKKQIQTNNIRDRTMNSVSAPDAASTLAEIIRPSYHNNVEQNH